MSRVIELQLTLQERVDKNGDTYLFGGFAPIPLVIFIRPYKGEVEGEGRRWQMQIKPYVKPDDREDDATRAWVEDSLDTQQTRTRTRNKRGNDE